MPRDSMYPANFDENLDMNVLGPIPRPDGSMVAPTPSRSRPADSGILARHNDTHPTDVSPPALDTFFRSLNGTYNSSAESSKSPTSPKRRGTPRASQLVRGGACEFCKRRKLKCTAEKPSCASCTRLGQPCVYSQKKQQSKVKVLEDRLIQLEKKLGGGGEAAGATPGSTLGAGDTLGPHTGHASNSISPDQEPDLMTLADAAASDNRFPWDGLTEDQIVREIIASVDGHRGSVGDHIVSHLLKLYAQPSPLGCLTLALNPTTFLARLQPHCPNPPHPALILSILPYLMPVSPSPILQQCAAHCVPIECSAKMHIQQALATVDFRLIDIIVSAHALVLKCYQESRLLEGWGNGHIETSLAWAAGLGKMRGVGESFLGISRELSRTELANHQRGEKLGELIKRMALVEPPRTVDDYQERVLLFWSVYAMDKASSVAANLSPGISDEEVTTPWPQNVYDEQGLRETSTINDLLQGRANTGFRDSDFCVQVKALCLLSQAARLFDLSSIVVSPERIANLKKVTRDYMASLTAPTSSFQTANWQTLHITMTFLHLREWVELERSASLALEEAVKSAEAAALLVDVAFELDPDLSHIPFYGVIPWQLAGAIALRTAQRLERDADHVRAARLRAVAAKLMQELAAVGVIVPYAKTMYQLLENHLAGSEIILGKYPREDRLD